MYYSICNQTDQPIEAYRVPIDPEAIWIRAGSRFAMSLTFAEAQRLIAELQRELAAVEAVARSAAA